MFPDVSQDGIHIGMSKMNTNGIGNLYLHLICSNAQDMPQLELLVWAQLQLEKKFN